MLIWYPLKFIDALDYDLLRLGIMQRCFRSGFVLDFLCRYTLGHLVERLGVDHKNGHVWLFDHGWIIKRPDFDDHGRKTGWRVARWVPQLGQNWRVTGLSRSERVKSLGSPSAL
jgi:hypothetical protein